MEEKILCPHCGREVSPLAHRCPGCRKELASNPKKTVYCKHCGTPINDGIPYCSKCGEPVKAAPKPAATPARPATDAAPQEPDDITYESVQTSGGNQWLYLTIGILLTLLFVGLFLIVTGKSEQQQGKTITTDSSGITAYGENAEEEPLTVYRYKVVGKKLMAVTSGADADTGYGWDDDAFGASITLLHQGDYDSDGVPEAIVYLHGGGSGAADPPFIVYYDKEAREFKNTDGLEDYNYDSMESERWQGQISIVGHIGLRTNRYVFKDRRVRLVERHVTAVGARLATYSCHRLFRSNEEGEKTVQADIDGDGITERLTFYRDFSPAMDNGNSMQLERIQWDDGRTQEEGLDRICGSSIAFLKSRSKGMPNLFVSDTWLYRWNGRYYEQTRDLSVLKEPEAPVSSSEIPFYEDAAEDEEF